MHFIEEHPYLSGSLALFGIVLFFMLRGSGSGSSASTTVQSSGVNPTVQAAQLASATALQQSNNAATVANNQISAQFAAKQLDVQAGVVQKQLDSQTTIQQALIAGNTATHLSDNDVALAQVQVGGQVQLAAQNGKNAVDLSTIQRGAAMDAINGNLTYATIEANKDITVSAQTIKGNLDYAGIQSDLEKYKQDTALTATKYTTDAQTSQAQANDDLQAYLAQLTAGVQNNYITTAGNVATVQSDNATAVSQHQLDNTGNLLNEIGAATIQNQRSSTGIAQIVAALFGTAQPQVQNSGFNFAVPGLFSVGITNP